MDEWDVIELLVEVLEQLADLRRINWPQILVESGIHLFVSIVGVFIGYRLAVRHDSKRQLQQDLRHAAKLIGAYFSSVASASLKAKVITQARDEREVIGELSALVKSITEVDGLIEFRMICEQQQLADLATRSNAILELVRGVNDTISHLLEVLLTYEGTMPGGLCKLHEQIQSLRNTVQDAYREIMERLRE